MTRRRAAAGAGLLALALFFAGSFARRDFNYGAETDFLGSFVPDAQRLLDGEPLRLEFHPPLYPAALALARVVAGDWLPAGLLLSAAGALLSLLAAWRLARPWGRAAAIGAIAGLCLSDAFVSYSQQATSDVFFTGLLLLGVALLATARDRPRHAFASGLVLGLAVLCRTNGVAALAFGAGLLPGDGGWSGRGRRLLPWLGGVASPLLVWLVVAPAIGAPLLPRETHANLALTYLAEGDRTSGDARVAAAEGLEDTGDVLARVQPARMVRIYARDLRTAVQSVFTQDLLVFPAAPLALPGLLLLLLRLVEGRQVGPLAGLVAMFLLLNLKAWESRYHLYLIPFLGAGLGLLGETALEAARRRGRLALLTAAAVVGAALALVELRRVQFEQGGGLSHDARAAAQVLAAYGPAPDARVVARKPHLCYYAALPCEEFPDAGDLDALGQALRQTAAADSGELFLFYGYAERLLRPGAWRLGLRDLEVPWLTQIGIGKETGKWVLYRVEPDALPEAPR